MKSTLKKILFSLSAIWLIWLASIQTTNAAKSLIGWELWEWDTNTDYTWQITKYNPWAWTDQFRKDSFIVTIRNFINRVLWLLSLIALAICLRWGFQMLTASGDETKYKKWFTILKQAWFGLAVIALAWLIVSVIFRVINLSTWSWTETWWTGGWNGWE